MAVFITGGGCKLQQINFISYIRSTGNQFIDTGFKPNNNTRVVMQASMPVIVSPSFYFGARTKNNTVNFNVLFTSSNIRSDYGESKVSIEFPNPKNLIKIDKNKRLCTVGEEILQNTQSEFQSSYNLFLFCSNDGGSPAYFSEIELAECQIYDNGVLVRDYAPCYDPNGVACLYEKVFGEYKYSDGDSDFIGG